MAKILPLTESKPCAPLTSSEKVLTVSSSAVAVVVANHDQRTVFARGDDLAEFVERHRHQRAGFLGIDDRLDPEFAEAP